MDSNYNKTNNVVLNQPFDIQSQNNYQINKANNIMMSSFPNVIEGEDFNLKINSTNQININSNYNNSNNKVNKDTNNKVVNNFQQDNQNFSYSPTKKDEIDNKVTLENTKLRTNNILQNTGLGSIYNPKAIVEPKDNKENIKVHNFNEGKVISEEIGFEPNLEEIETTKVTIPKKDVKKFEKQELKQEFIDFVDYNVKETEKVNFNEVNVFEKRQKKLFVQPVRTGEVQIDKYDPNEMVFQDVDETNSYPVEFKPITKVSNENLTINNNNNTNNNNKETIIEKLQLISRRAKKN